MDPRGRLKFRGHRYYSFGTTLHRVLQRFHDSHEAGVETVREAMAAVDEDWVTGGYSNPSEMMEAMGEGKEIIGSYVEAMQANPRPGKVLFVEKTLRLELNDFVLTGRLDRVDELPDGRLEILDYKTQRGEVTAEEVASDFAMCCYQLLLQRAYPDRIVCATILAVRSMEQATTTMTQAEMDEFEFDLSELGRAILNKNFYELVPVAKPLCVGCDFIDYCRLHPDY